MIIQEIKIEVKKKVKINKNFNAADDQKLAADKMQPVSIEFSMSFANDFWVKEWIFLI